MDEQLLQGIGLFNDGEFFRCHEVLEEAWSSEHGPRRLFLQALIHVAVGFYHSQRGNTAGAVRQLRKGIEKLAAYAPSCKGMDTAQLHRDALVATEAIEAGIRLSAYPRIHASSDTSSYLRRHPPLR
jgi:predicted metal-dependent hydrolase